MEELRYLSVTKQRVCGIELAVTVIALKESWLRSPRDLDPEEGAIPEGSRPNNPAIAAKEEAKIEQSKTTFSENIART